MINIQTKLTKFFLREEKSIPLIFIQIREYFFNINAVESNKCTGDNTKNQALPIEM
jgi:hypothetical protein